MARHHFLGLNEDKYMNELYNQIEKLLSDVYMKYQVSFSENEKKDCELYLYEQGEYELAYNTLIATLEDNSIKMDEQSVKKMDEAKKLMEL